jgi:hypothetical protein
MNRNNYLMIENFKIVHDYLCSLLLKIDNKVKCYLEETLLFPYLVNQSLTLGSITPSTQRVTYSLVYDFFKEPEKIGFRENQISFIIWIRFNQLTECFDYVLSEIENSGTVISKIHKHENLRNLPNEITTILDDTPAVMVSFIDGFIKNVLNENQKNIELFEKYYNNNYENDTEKMKKLLELYIDASISPFTEVKEKIEGYIKQTGNDEIYEYIKKLDLDN